LTFGLTNPPQESKNNAIIIHKYKKNFLLSKGKKGMKFRLNNRLDVKDECKKWLEAIIIDVNIFLKNHLFFFKRSVKIRLKFILWVTEQSSTPG
jgi:hypothetical protein